MMYVFACLIAMASVALGRSFGIVGMIAPWVVVGLVYGLVDLVMGGLIALVEERDRG